MSSERGGGERKKNKEDRKEFEKKG